MARKSGSKRHHGRYRAATKLSRELYAATGKPHWVRTGRYTTIHLTKEQWEELFDTTLTDEEWRDRCRSPQ